MPASRLVLSRETEESQNSKRNHGGVESAGTVGGDMTCKRESSVQPMGSDAASVARRIISLLSAEVGDLRQCVQLRVL